MGFFLYIILALIFGALGFGAAEYLRKLKDAGADKAKGGGGSAGGGGAAKSGKSRSAETATSTGTKKKAKK
ncbi:hypothetical protein Mgra_00004460 [Meloidogyne graminicola]|uniref:Uncharacterized protein n=1 Tax=Meloidogyne graminicola TaxID=189291 RepID=A0A8S9ZSS7_9BILA|nr:hypothetical protein Mgra_00004460 [Meloidogyne graminicola]